MKKICVYTCITGEYDNVNEIVKNEKNIDFFLFTNNKNIKSKTWNVIFLDNPEKLNNHMLSRKIKILGHPLINNKYDIALWMDASICFKKSIKEFIKKYYDENKAFFSAFKHSERNCIYKEMNECLKKRKDAKTNIIKTKKFLLKEGFPENYGLCEMTVFIKNLKNEQVKKLCELWYKMVLKYSKRDQLSFMYCVWKYNIKINVINQNVWNNNWFEAYPHNYENQIKNFRVYFGDENSFDIEKNYIGQMNNKNGSYNIKVKIPCNTKKAVVELSKVPFIKLMNIKINNIKYLKIHYFNAIKNGNEVFFFNENGAFEIYNYLKKGDILNIKMNLEQASQKEIVKMFSIHNQEMEEVNNCLREENYVIKNQNKNIEKKLNMIQNSMTWKIRTLFTKTFGGGK